MAIDAKTVMSLREKTQVGMMDCKKALQEAGGDIEKAEEILLKSGAAKADNKSTRVAEQGAVFAAVNADNTAAALIEINCETDFVAKNEDFVTFSNKLAEIALEHKVIDAASLLTLQFDASNSVEDMRKLMVAKLGENIQIRRAHCMQAEQGCVVSYSHGGRIVTLVNLSTDNQDVAKDIAMHVAALRPSSISAEGIAEDEVTKQREVFAAQVANSGKPAEIAEKIITGKINKFLDENSLLGQVFVKDSKQKVTQYLATNKCKVLSFLLYEVGVSGNESAVVA